MHHVYFIDFFRQYCVWQDYSTVFGIDFNYLLRSPMYNFPGMHDFFVKELGVPPKPPKWQLVGIFFFFFFFFVTVEQIFYCKYTSGYNCKPNLPWKHVLKWIIYSYFFLLLILQLFLLHISSFYIKRDYFSQQNGSFSKGSKAYCATFFYF
jgi:hypothetical protein